MRSCHAERSERARRLRLRAVGVREVPVYVIPSGANEVSVVEGSPARRMPRHGCNPDAPVGDPSTPLAPLGMTCWPCVALGPAIGSHVGIWSLGWATATRRAVRLTTACGPDCASGDSLRAILCIRRQPTSHTVHLATAGASNCASGDNWRPRLCLRRQPEHQTVHLATAGASDCASGDNERTETGSGCRRMHSLSRGVSPDAQFIARRVARCTVWCSGCRRRHSLGRGGPFSVTY